MSTKVPGQITNTVFEGLFVKALTPDLALRAKLKHIGYDIDHQLATYPAAVWDEALRVTAAYIYPNLADRTGMRKLGEVFMVGFFETFVGRLIGVALPLIGGDGLLKRAPRYWASGSVVAKLETTREAPGRWRLKMADPTPHPDFDAGVFEEALRRSGETEGTMEILERRMDGFVALIRWTSK